MQHDNRRPAQDPQELARLFVSRGNSGDLDGMVALYESDAVLAIGNNKLARGTEEIREFYRGLLATGVRFSVGEQRPAIQSGGVALTSTRLPDGSMTAEIAHQQSDGSWLWVIDQPNVAVPE